MGKAGSSSGFERGNCYFSNRVVLLAEWLPFRGVEGTYQISSGIPLRGNSPFLHLYHLCSLQDGTQLILQLVELLPWAASMSACAALQPQRSALQGAALGTGSCALPGRLPSPNSVKDEQVPTLNLTISAPPGVELFPRVWVGGL